MTGAPTGGDRTNGHGNTMNFGSAGSVFGFVNSSKSGYSSSDTNATGTTWGGASEGTGASALGGCTDHDVACTN